MAQQGLVGHVPPLPLLLLLAITAAVALHAATGTHAAAVVGAIDKQTNALDAVPAPLREIPPTSTNATSSAKLPGEGKVTFEDIFSEISREDFFASVYQDHLHIEHGGVFAAKSREIFTPLTDIVSFCQQQVAFQGTTKGFQIKHEGKTISVDDCDHLKRALDEDGSGVVVRYEDMSFPPSPSLSQADAGASDDEAAATPSSGPPPAPVAALHELVANEFGADSTVHLYHATADKSRALLPHTDPYDVLVLQLEGSKQWTACVPDLKIEDPQHRQLFKEHAARMHRTYEEEESDALLSQAHKGQLQEIQRKKLKGCTSYEDHDLSAYQCEHFTLSAGDVMFLPKGVIHFAIAEEHGSSHITISIEREGTAWGDAVAAGIRGVFGDQEQENSQEETITGDHDLIFTMLSGLRAALDSDFGVLLLNAMPMHELLQTCPTAEGSMGTKAADAQLDAIVAEYESLCTSLSSFLVSATADDLAARFFFDALLRGQEGDLTKALAAVCSRDTFLAEVRDPLCASPANAPAQRRLKVDVTSTRFMKTYRARRSMLSEQQLLARDRRATDHGSYVCNSACNDGCNVFTGGCDGSCTTVCNSGCTLCDAACDGTVCNTNCNTGCDDAVCNSGCTSGCDGRVCNTGCDGSCNAGCDDSCNGCDGSCDSSCIPFTSICFSSCDSSCDGSCNSGCDTCYSACDDSCTLTSCDDSCNTGCTLAAGCDEGCTGGCVGTSCDENCDGPCNTGCVTTCNTDCDENPDPASCTASCDGSCACKAGYYGTGSSCTTCPNNYYSAQPNQPSCTSCASLSCSSGQYRVGCGSSTPGQCTNCPSCEAGHYLDGCSGLSSGTCKACPTGKYQPQQGATSCIDCSSCSPGYVRTGCSGASPGSCLGVQCVTPPTVTHATVSTSNSGRYQSTATYSCEAGYVLADSSVSTLTCGTNGMWSGTLPQCIGAPCEPLSISRSIISPSGAPRYPTTYSISCESGYERDGAASLQCLADGSWSSAPPSCPGRECQQVDIPAQGSVSYTNSGRYPSTATYSCNPGYQPDSETTTRTCTTSGTFSGDPVACVGKPCNSLDAPQNGAVRFSTTPPIFPATAQFTCDPGYMLQGSATGACSTDQTWEIDEAPACVGVPCSIGDVENGAVETTAESYPASATITCNAGYGLIGTSQLSCSTAGEYPTLPTCSLCPPNSYAADSSTPCVPCPAHSSTNGASGQSECVCLPGHEPDPNSDNSACRQCAPNSIQPSHANDACTACRSGYETRDGDYTECVGVVCDPLPVVAYSTASAGAGATLLFPATVTYTCQEGFRSATTQAAREHIACTASGQWSDTPVCEPICGDGLIVPGEECDDGNLNGMDGCSVDCQLEDTHACTDPGKPCTYCSVATLPSDLLLSCTAADIEGQITEWLQDHGGMRAIAHPHCTNADTQYTYSLNSTIGDPTTGCYEQMYVFEVDFNNGAVKDYATAVVRVSDTNSPTFNRVPDHTRVECSSVPRQTNLVASDACMSSAPSVTPREVRIDGGCLFNYTLTRMWTTEDECGNTMSVNTTITVQDTTEPDFIRTPDFHELQCVADTTTAINQFVLRRGNAVIEDNCDEGLTVTSRIVAADRSGCSGTGNVTYSVSATDTCGNTNSAEAVLTVVDNLPPVPINKPDDITVSCDNVPAIPTDVIVRDQCQNRVYPTTVTERRIDGACANAYTLHREFHFQDACTNADSALQIITVTDNSGPRIVTIPSDLYLECSEDNDEAIEAWLARRGGATADDDCSSRDTITWRNDYDEDALNVTCGSTGVYTVVFEAVDQCEHATPVTGRIHIRDTQVPMLRDVPQDITTTCDAVPAPFNVGASDNCTELPAITLVEQRLPGECSSRYQLYRTWTATDDCMNNVTDVQAITVTDAIPPVLAANASDMTFSCSLAGNEGAFAQFLSGHGGAQADDACTATAWIYSDPSTALDPSMGDRESHDPMRSSGCGNTFTSTVVFYAHDDCGNYVSTTATFQAVDRDEPVFQDKPAETREVQCAALEAQETLLAVDVCNGPTGVSMSELVVPGRCAHSYALHRDWTATDACNNTAIFDQLISVIDTEGPAVLAQPTPLVLECSSETNEASIQEWLSANGNASAQDTCDPPEVTWTHNFERVRAALEYGCGNNTVEVTFTATDVCGNPTDIVGTITIVDTQEPVFTQEAANAMFECHAEENAAQLAHFRSTHGGASASDTCLTQLTWTMEEHVTPACGSSLSHHFAFTASDGCEHNITTYATIDFIDSLPPVAILRGGNPQVTPVGFSWQDPSVEIPPDACHGAVILTPHVSGEVDHATIGVYNITYSVVDDCGHENILNRSVNVVDAFPPSVVVNGERTLFLRKSDLFLDLNDPVVLSDNYDQEPDFKTLVLRRGALTEDRDSATREVGSFQVVYTASDGSNNRASIVGRQVVVLDSVPTLPESVDISLMFDLSVTLPQATAADAGARQWYAVDVVFGRGLSQSDIMQELEPLKLFGQAMRNVVWGTHGAHVTASIALSDVTSELLSAAAASPLIAVVGRPVPIASFRDTVRPFEGCNDAAVADTLERQSREAVSSSCDGCPLCEFSALEPATFGDSVDALELAEGEMWVVEVAKKHGAGIFPETVLLTYLHEAGVHPVNLRVGNATATFVTRSRVILAIADPQGSFAQDPSFLLSVSTITSATGTRFTINVVDEVHRVGLTVFQVRASLYSVGIVPSMLTTGTDSGDGEVGLTVVVETYNDVSKTRIAALTALSWVESVQNIMYLEPSGIVEREQPYTYYVESSTAATSDFSLSAFGEHIVAVFEATVGGSRAGAPECRAVASTYGCSVAFSDRFSDANATALAARSEFASIELISDSSVATQIHSSLVQLLDRLVPYDHEHFTVAVQHSRGGQSNRRRRDATESEAVSAVISVHAPPRPQLINDNIGGIDYGDARYRLEFDLIPATLEDQQEERARLVLTEILVPTYSFTVESNHVTAEIATVLRDVHVDALTAHSYVVADSIKPPESMSSWLNNVDIAYVVESLVANGALAPHAEERRLPPVAFSSSVHEAANQQPSTASGALSQQWVAIIAVLCVIAFVAIVAVVVVTRYYRNKSRVHLDLSANSESIGNRAVFANPLYSTTFDVTNEDKTPDYDYIEAEEDEASEYRDIYFDEPHYDEASTVNHEAGYIEVGGIDDESFDL